MLKIQESIYSFLIFFTALFSSEFFSINVKKYISKKHIHKKYQNIREDKILTNSFPFYKSTSDSCSDPIDIMTVAEVAAFLGVGKNRIYELLNKGTIKGFRMGSTWKISKMALEAYIREASGL